MGTNLAKVKEFYAQTQDKSLMSKYNARRADKSLRFKAEQEYALQRIRDSEQLQNCRPATVRQALLDQATTGLSLSPVLQHAYLIPWGDVATFSPSYRGLVHLLTKAGTLKSIQAAVVRQNDDFDYGYTEDGGWLRHNPARKNPGPPTHAWALAKFTNGERHLEVMSWEEVERCRAGAERLHKGKTPPAWRQWPEEMAKKCAIRRGWKFWPMDDSGQIAAAMQVMDKAEPIDFGEAPPREDEKQELLLSREDVHALESFTRNLGVDEPEKWLSGLSRALGYDSIDQVPAKRFEECKERIRNRWDRMQEQPPEGEV